MKNSKNTWLIVLIAVIVLVVIVLLFLYSGNGTMMNGGMNGRMN